jgi:hypothetical protein
MQADMSTPEEIQKSIYGTRRRIDDDLEELGRRMRQRSEAFPGWVRGAGIAGAVILLRRPIFRLLKTAAILSAPVVLPILVQKFMERSQNGVSRGSTSFR